MSINAATPFGRTLLSEWLLDPAYAYLNHGTVGAPPRRVIDAQRSIVDEIEAQPARFLLRELADITGEATVPSRIRVAAAAVAEFVGVDAADLAFVDNITAGANSVLRSFPFAAGDEVLVTDLGYGGITNAVEYAARRSGATVRTLMMPHGSAGPAAFVDAVAEGLGERTRILVVDHITAETALILPIAEIARVAHDRGVLVFADGAHVPGSIPLEIASLGVDWYSGNLHKWALTPRSAGILWASPEQQATLHPAVISWGLDNGMSAEFDLTGTRDPSPWLAAPAALAMLHDFGFERVCAYNHDLVWRAAGHLAERWGTEFAIPESMVPTMVAIPATPPDRYTSADAQQLKDRLLFDEQIEVAAYEQGGAIVVRVSAQIYNDMDDIDRLAEAVLRHRPGSCRSS